MSAEDFAAYAGHRPRLNRPPAGLLGKLLAFVLSAALLVAGLMFSLVVLAVVAVLGAGFAGWLWCKTRQLRRQLAQAARPPHPASAGSGQVIDGVAVRQDDAPSASPRLPDR